MFIGFYKVVEDVLQNYIFKKNLQIFFNWGVNFFDI